MLSLSFTATPSIFNVGVNPEETGHHPGPSHQLLSVDSTTLESQPNSHPDLTVLDQVITMASATSSSYDVVTTSGGGMGHVTNILHHQSQTPIASAALFESKELGISYTFQSETSNNDILQ